jgi:ribosomal protein L10
VYNVEIDDSILPGQIAVVCSNDDAVSALGKVNEFMKGFAKNPKIVWA